MQEIKVHCAKSLFYGVKEIDCIKKIQIYYALFFTLFGTISFHLLYYSGILLKNSEIYYIIMEMNLSNANIKQSV